MTRPFDFGANVRKLARLRQHGRCARCGDDLTDLEEHAHHVVPNQSGMPRNPAHAWLGAQDNCVLLCVPCHERVHEDGRFRDGAVAPASYYPHSHGSRTSPLHRAWVLKVEALTRSVWR